MNKEKFIPSVEMEESFACGDAKSLINNITMTAYSDLTGEKFYQAVQYFYAKRDRFNIFESYDGKGLVSEAISENEQSLKSYMEDNGIANIYGVYSKAISKLTANFCIERVNDVRKVSSQVSKKNQSTISNNVINSKINEKKKKREPIILYYLLLLLVAISVLEFVIIVYLLLR